jgi:hypothetical protein
MDNSIPRNFVSHVGPSAWAARFQEIRRQIGAGAQTGRLAAQRYAAECAIEKARRGQKLSGAETALVELATRIPALHDQLRKQGRDRLGERLDAALTGEATIFPLLHLLHTANLQQSRGFDVAFTGLSEATPFDLLISRDGADAEIACDTISAEEGHAVNRGTWTRLIDRIDPDLQTWLAAHPGRYLLKMTLPNGLKGPAELELPALHKRIKDMLASARRADYDEAAMLRLDPLLLAGAQANDGPAQAGVISKLRREFGPEAHLAVTEAGASVFVMAARAAAENEVAVAVRRRLAAIAPTRLSGTRPGIISLLIDDTDALEWRSLREQMMLEGETRHFLTFPEARHVVAVTCASRYELAQATPPLAAPGGDLRFRNPMHPAAKSPALAPAVVSTV